MGNGLIRTVLFLGVGTVIVAGACHYSKKGLKSGEVTNEIVTMVKQKDPVAGARLDKIGERQDVGPGYDKLVKDVFIASSETERNHLLDSTDAALKTTPHIVKMSENLFQMGKILFQMR